jgi:hypothetical protein
VTPEQPSNEVLAERIAALDDHLSLVQSTLNERINESDKNLREHVRTQVTHVSDALAASQRENKLIYDAQEKATKVALEAATALGKTHNDLLRKGEVKDATYATKDMLTAFKEEREHRFESLRDVYEPRFQRIETFQIRLGTVALVLFAIGVTNLVKLWFS